MLAQAARDEEPVNERSAHVPVLLREVLEFLAPRTGATLVDGTLGAAGHTAALLDAVGAEGRVIGFDRDPQAISQARARFADLGTRFTAVHADYRELLPRLTELGVDAIDGMLLDLGLSSVQLDDPLRGFSFRMDGPLDMRFDPTHGESAAELLARLSAEELAQLLWRFGEERRARTIARAILRSRDRQPITRTTQLAELVAEALGPAARRERIHPATRSFQALRIAVNEELDGLRSLVGEITGLLRPAGRLAVIAFHSLEDREIKHGLRDEQSHCTCPPRLPLCTCGRPGRLRILTPRPVRPGEVEIVRNPRARSARLRAAERV